MLSRFKELGGKGYGEFSSGSGSFSGQIKDALSQADKIRFNLVGVNVNRVNNMSGLINQFGEPTGGYTNYELYLIKNTPEFLNKTIFYLDGNVVPSPF